MACGRAVGDSMSFESLDFPVYNLGKVVDLNKDCKELENITYDGHRLRSNSDLYIS